MKSNRLLLTLAFGTLLALAPTAAVNKVDAQVGNLPQKHLITNKDGSYGGNLDVAKYGEGAPLNGELDHPEAEYFTINDYYNATSTTSRVLVHNFQGYQQTTANSSGIACAKMVLHHYGYTDSRIYSEERLIKKYEALTSKSVKDNGTTLEGLQTLFNRYGLVAKANVYKGGRDATKLTAFVEDALKNDYLMLLPYRAESGEYRWHVVIGVDDLGESYYNNNVLILADPFDANDHYQDGYKVVAINNFIKYWLDMDRDITLATGATKETVVYPCENLLVKAPEGKHLDIHEGPETLVQEAQIPQEDRHLRNPDGTIGGMMLDENGKASMGGTNLVWNNRADDPISVKVTPYYTYNDYYTYDDHDSALFLNHFQAKKQTTASTCGVCSTLSTLVYLGIPYNEANRDLNDYSCTGEFKIMRQIEKAANTVIYNSGVANYEITKILDGYGMKAKRSAGYNMTNYLKGTADKVYPTFAKFSKAVQEDLGQDLPFLMGWNSTGGHWQVIIGYDTMGTESPYDDVCVLADSSDWADGVMDGYNTWNAMWVYNRWFNGSFHWNQQGVTIQPK